MGYVFTWLALMILLGLTFASSYIAMGPWNTVANTGISCAKALLIAVFFMHLRHAGPLLRIAAVTGVIWLALLFGLSSTDYATRDLSPAPWAKR
ncbi:MAG TPA: cytochrome C oxidase subunit IV family protein [Burkholderiales bacterium]|jgi:cytochrome c oxidase subunit IV|nr:cytochrome C oxidase subunit IV family protein [Burkholderiales bacterium]